MNTVFQLGSIIVFKDATIGWCIRVNDTMVFVYNTNHIYLLKEVIRVFGDNPTMRKTMGDFFQVVEERIRYLELKAITKKVMADLAQVKKEFQDLCEEAEKRQVLINKMEGRNALLALIEQPGEWVTAPFTGHSSEGSLSDFVKTLRIKDGVLESVFSYRPQEEYRTAWINMATLVSGSHINENEMAQYTGPTKGDAIYAWCKRTMERFW